MRPMPATASSQTTDDNPLDHGGQRNPSASALRPQGVSRELITAILELARRAPSGVNTQPWNVYVLQGASRDALVRLARSALPALLSDVGAQSCFWDQFKRLPGSSSWPGPDWQQPGGDFLASANAAFGGGNLQDAAALQRYFGLHGAPVALVCTIDSALGLGSVLDCGMFLQNIAAAAADRGLYTEVQTGWRGLADNTLAQMEAPAATMLLAVMAMGHAAPSAAHDGSSHQPQAQTSIVWHA